MPQETQTQETQTQDNSEAQNLAAETQAQAMLQAMTADPNIQKILLAHREGRSVEVVETEPKRQETQPEKPDATETLPDGDKVVAKTIIQALEAKINPVIDRINTLEQLAQGLQSNTVKAQVTEAQGKYPDFGKHTKEMAQISKENPALSIDDLYVLAKARKGDLKLAKEEPFSERPTETPARPERRERGKDDPAMARGSKGFANHLAEVLDKMTFKTS